MSIRLRCASFALALVAGSGMAIAQTPPATPGGVDDSITHPAPPARSISQFQRTPAQRTTILNAVRQGSAKVASPVNFVASVGAPVPPSIELYLLPDGVLAQVPEARVVKYTTVQNKIVLVDPTTMRIVDVISQ